MSYLNAFIYTRGNTFLHRLDPRSKGVMALSAAFSLGLFVGGVYTYLIFIMALFVAIYFAGLGSQLYPSLRSYAVLALLLFAVNLWATRSLNTSIIVVERLILFVELFSLISLTTSPVDLGVALLKMGLPNTFVMAFTMALRFLPTVAAELKSIEDSQRVRGLELDKGGFIERLRKHIPILIPLLVNTILRAEQVAEAMESKCFGASPKPTGIRELKFKAIDWATLVLSLAALAALSYHYALTHTPITIF